MSNVTPDVGLANSQQDPEIQGLQDEIQELQKFVVEDTPQNNVEYSPEDIGGFDNHFEGTDFLDFEDEPDGENDDVLQNIVGWVQDNKFLVIVGAGAFVCITGVVAGIFWFMGGEDVEKIDSTPDVGMMVAEPYVPLDNGLVASRMDDDEFEGLSHETETKPGDDPVVGSSEDKGSVKNVGWTAPPMPIPTNEPVASASPSVSPSASSKPSVKPSVKPSRGNSYTPSNTNSRPKPSSKPSSKPSVKPVSSETTTVAKLDGVKGDLSTGTANKPSTGVLEGVASVDGPTDSVVGDGVSRPAWIYQPVISYVDGYPTPYTVGVNGEDLAGLLDVKNDSKNNSSGGGGGVNGGVNGGLGKPSATSKPTSKPSASTPNTGGSSAGETGAITYLNIPRGWMVNGKIVQPAEYAAVNKNDFITVKPPFQLAENLKNPYGMVFAGGQDVSGVNVNDFCMRPVSGRKEQLKAFGDCYNLMYYMNNNHKK